MVGDGNRCHAPCLFSLRGYPMQVDAFYAMGSQHIFCQDYALASSYKRSNAIDCAHGIVCDGCSSSKDTDVGARMVALAMSRQLTAKNNIGPHQEFEDVGFNLEDAQDAFTLTNRALVDAEASTHVLGLPHTCLDSTIAFVKADGPKTVMAAIIGDGFVISRRKNGSIKVIKVTYEQNAPYYPSYRLDYGTREVDFNNKLVSPRTFEIWSGDDDEVEKFPIPYSASDHTKYWGLWLNTSVFDLVAVASDGLASVPGMPWYKVAQRLFDFKSMAGSFVQRRGRRFMADMAEEGLSPQDDVSVAAIYFG
jgi:hypothetical protein